MERWREMRVKSDFEDNPNDKLYVPKEMKGMAGKAIKVCDIGEFYECEDGWSWAKEWLEPVIILEVEEI